MATQKREWITFFGLLAAILTVIYFLFFTLTPTPETGPKEKIRIGLSKDPVAWNFLVAVQKGFLAQQGLELEVISYPSGKRALKGLLNGEVDYCNSSEVPVAFSAFKHSPNEFGIIATIGSVDNEVKVIARRDSGIAEPSDLKGKRVGTQSFSAVHFFLDMFLQKYAMRGHIDLIYEENEDLSHKLSSGELDAISTREPFLTMAMQSLGDNAIIFQEPGLYRKSSHIVASTSVIAGSPEVSKKLLKALLMAEAWMQQSPAEAAAFIAKTIHVDELSVLAFLKDADLRIRFDQSIIQTLEDVGAWALDEGFTESRTIPNYFSYLHPEILADIKPVSVTIVY
ncbi:MAG: ABC transporter substrate-binding protein [Gammaproteobacteria bacterium]|nr:ABC transporter substrate-binding protein [Gammaproteobacteria bacterium]